MPVLIKQLVVLQQSLLLLLQLPAVTGRVVPVLLFRIEMLLMQSILQQYQKLEQQLFLHGMFLTRMALVFVLRQLIK